MYTAILTIKINFYSFTGITYYFNHKSLKVNPALSPCDDFVSHIFHQHQSFYLSTFPRRRLKLIQFSYMLPCIQIPFVFPYYFCAKDNHIETVLATDSSSRTNSTHRIGFQMALVRGRSAYAIASPQQPTHKTHFGCKEISHYHRFNILKMLTGLYLLRLKFDVLL